MRTLFILLLLLSSLLKLATAQQPSIGPDFDSVDVYLQKAVADFGMVGLSVVVFKDSGVVFEKAYGYKNAEKKIPLKTESLFNIASCTKAFTAACLAMLVDEGKLKWEDKVTDYLPEFQLADPWITRELNIVDILSHRSGLSTFTGDLLWYETDYSKEEIIRRMRYLPIENDFRSEFGYQNNMFMVAGEIVERVSGMPWEQYLEKKLFERLNMKQSRSSSSKLSDGQDVALPHLEGEPKALYLHRADPAWSIYSSVDELAHWVGMLANGGIWQGDTVLSPSVIRAMFTPHTLQGVSNFYRNIGMHFKAYGLGWNLFDYGGALVAEHGGGMPGYLSKVVVVPEKKLGFVILTNDMNILYSGLVYYFLDLYLKEKPADWAGMFLNYKQRGEAYDIQEKETRYSQRAENTSPSHDLTAYAGLYRDRYYGDAEIELQENGKLRLTLVPTKEMFTSEMSHWHFDTFRIRFVDEFLPEGFVTFSFDSNGGIEGFKIDLPNPDFHFYKLDFKRVTGGVTE